ncbi:MAG: hypothetical protein M3R72_07560 [Bacteroidota bacterium]|nr:hypothetical protein [Bacteroidota bacterium]
MIKTTLLWVWFCTFFIACYSNKQLAYSSGNHLNDTLIQNINKSKSDNVQTANSTLKKWAKQNDLIIAFATLNYAWTRKGTYYVFTCKNNQWKLYSYQVKLNAVSDSAIQITSIKIPDSEAENIKRLYASSQLWKTSGDERGNFCNDNKDCNITDAETWTLSVATPENIHTTTYYAPEFFEGCCPGNPYRQQFVTIAKEIEKIASNINSM